MKQRFLCSLLLVLLVAVMVLSTGCAAPGMTKKEVNRRHYESIQNNYWQMQDDFDSFWLIDQPSRLSPMMVR